MKAIR